jgi:nucleoside-diphosphate-sugar epimerase
LMTDQEVVDEFITTRDIDVIFHKAVKVGVRPSVTA